MSVAQRTARVLQAPPDDPLFLARRRLVQTIVAFVIVRDLLLIVPQVGQSNILAQDAGAGLFYLVVNAVLLTLHLLWFVLAQRGAVNSAAVGQALTLMTAMLVLGQDSSRLLAVIVAATLPNTLLFVTVVIVGVLAAAPEIFANPTLEGAGASVGGAVQTLAVALTVRPLLGAVRGAIGRAQSSARVLDVGARVTEVTADVADLNSALDRSVRYLQEALGYYHVQVFLLDDAREQAVLVASTGEAGRRLLERNHQLGVGSRSVIGRATASGKPIIVQDTATSDVHSRNELLPNTRAELAVPILDRGRVVGALDVQSTRPAAFDANITDGLQVVANLLGTVVRNYLVQQQQQQVLQENQRLYLETEANLRDVQRINRQLTAESWTSYLTDLREELRGITLDGQSVRRDADWSEVAARAAATRQPASTATPGGQRTVAVPIALRGEVIGALEVEPDDTLSEADVVEMLRTLAERLAISLDNARLVEEAQSATAYEQRIGDISARYQRATTADELLRITLSELGSTLGASHAAIRLGVTHDAATPQPLPLESEAHS